MASPTIVPPRHDRRMSLKTKYERSRLEVFRFWDHEIHEEAEAFVAKVKEAFLSL